MYSNISSCINKHEEFGAVTEYVLIHGFILYTCRGNVNIAHKYLYMLYLLHLKIRVTTLFLCTKAEYIV